MNVHDQELLEKQLHGLTVAPRKAVIALTVLTVFFAGIALGGFLYAFTSDEKPMQQIAANDVGVNDAAVLPHTAPQIKEWQ